jgi:hypothetical protein
MDAIHTRFAEPQVHAGINSPRPWIGAKVPVDGEANAQIVGFAIEGAGYRIDTVEG